ncbi:MAG: hypothetical protein ACYCXA_01090, partial [Actinomycetes bacterium]
MHQPYVEAMREGGIQPVDTFRRLLGVAAVGMWVSLLLAAVGTVIVGRYAESVIVHPAAAALWGVAG